MLFQKEFQEKYGEKKIEFSMFYVAKAGNEVLGKKEQMIEALTKADVAVVDIMGASEADIQFGSTIFHGSFRKLACNSKKIVKAGITIDA